MLAWGTLMWEKKVQFHCLFVDETRNRFFKEAESEYLKRLKRYCPVSVHIVKGEKMSRSASEAEIRKKETERLVEKIPTASFVVVLDQTGKEMTSEELADQVQTWQNRSLQHVAFVVGGPLGMDDSITQRADLVLSLSQMTFVHEMVRVFLLEQLYRAWTILRNEKYHK